LKHTFASLKATIAEQQQTIEDQAAYIAKLEQIVDQTTVRWSAPQPELPKLNLFALFAAKFRRGT
jgi:uncharacterized coiled-coil protein SlyX